MPLYDELAALERPGSVRRIAASVVTSEEAGELLALAVAADERIAYRAAWAASHLADGRFASAGDRFAALAARATAVGHPGLLRLLLGLLLRSPLPAEPPVDLLDLCLDGMEDPARPPAVRVLCMKLGAALCRPIPELEREWRLRLDAMEEDALPPSLRTARRNLLRSGAERAAAGGTPRSAGAPLRPPVGKE